MKAARLTVLGILALCAASLYAGGDGEPKVPDITIHEAALMGDVRAIEQHVAVGTDLNSLDAYGSTPLTIAATFGMSDVARALIDAGADLGMTNDEGSTPLHNAAFFCREEIVQMLLDGGARRDVRNASGLMPVDMVAAPFEQVKPIYDGILESLGPIGLELDYEHLAETRPQLHSLLAE